MSTAIQQGPGRVIVSAIGGQKLKLANFSNGLTSIPVLKNGAQTPEDMPVGYELEPLDTICAEQLPAGGSFEVQESGTTEIVVTQGTPADISVPDPSFFDDIEDYYDAGFNHTAFQIGDDTISIRG